MRSIYTGAVAALLLGAAVSTAATAADYRREGFQAGGAVVGGAIGGRFGGSSGANVGAGVGAFGGGVVYDHPPSVPTYSQDRYYANPSWGTSNSTPERVGPNQFQGWRRAW